MIHDDDYVFNMARTVVSRCFSLAIFVSETKRSLAHTGLMQHNVTNKIQQPNSNTKFVTQTKSEIPR